MVLIIDCSLACSPCFVLIGSYGSLEKGCYLFFSFTFCFALEFYYGETKVLKRMIEKEIKNVKQKEKK